VEEVVKNWIQQHEVVEEESKEQYADAIERIKAVTASKSNEGVSQTRYTLERAAEFADLVSKQLVNIVNSRFK